MYYYRMIFQEDREGYATEMEVFRSQNYSVVIEIRLADEEYDPMYSQSIELNALDIRALADELNRLANEIEKQAKKPVALITEGKQKKKTGGEVHARYTKVNGQMELMQ